MSWKKENYTASPNNCAEPGRAEALFRIVRPDPKKSVILSAPFATFAPSRFRLSLTARYAQDAKYAKIRSARRRNFFVTGVAGNEKDHS